MKAGAAHGSSVLSAYASNVLSELFAPAVGLVHNSVARGTSELSAYESSVFLSLSASRVGLDQVADGHVGEQAGDVGGDVAGDIDVIGVVVVVGVEYL